MASYYLKIKEDLSFEIDYNILTSDIHSFFQSNPVMVPT